MDIYPEHTTLFHRKLIESQFNYAALIWEFCRKTCNSKIEKIHHKTLRVINSSPLTKASIPNILRIYSTYCGTNAIHFRATLIWNNFLAIIKPSQSLGEVKGKIKNHENMDCGRFICKQSTPL